MKKAKYSFDSISFHNRWKGSKSCRNSDWTIIGISEWWTGPTLFCFKFCVFGFELKVWLNRKFK